jgi:hypothetical protein
MAVEDIGEITHPPFVMRHIEGDRYTFDYHYGGIASRLSDVKNNRLLPKFKQYLKKHLSIQ